MEKRFPNRIHIIGSVGSGKTTLARTLSTKSKVQHYELDNVVWKRERSGNEIRDIRRSDEERDEYLNNIVNLNVWIIEGVHHKWVTPSLDNADLIIFLDTKYSIRIVRIIRRFILQKLGIEKANYKPTFKMFKQMFRWNAYFENESKQEILDILSQYNEKLIILSDNAEINKFIKL
ncbi:DNA topology modulation protein FlaR [Lysinibacillus sp. PLM2]|nr:DNA topology modulation protein FlaR [Lysinibacillus sp. PLM2]